MIMPPTCVRLNSVCFPLQALDENVMIESEEDDAEDTDDLTEKKLMFGLFDI